MVFYNCVDNRVLSQLVAAGPFVQDRAPQRPVACEITLEAACEPSAPRRRGWCLGASATRATVGRWAGLGAAPHRPGGRWGWPGGCRTGPGSASRAPRRADGGVRGAFALEKQQHPPGVTGELSAENGLCGTSGMVRGTKRVKPGRYLQRKEMGVEKGFVDTVDNTVESGVSSQQSVTGVVTGHRGQPTAMEAKHGEHPIGGAL